MSATPHPLCELHVHLEGCVWPGHIEAWWHKSDYLFGPPRLRESGSRFERFLDHLRFGYNFLNTEDAYGAVAVAYAERAVAAGICYAELQLNLGLLRTWNLDVEGVVGAIRLACAEVENAPTLRFVIDLPWQFNPAAFEEIIERAPQLMRLGVGAISMGGDETLARPSEVRPLFDGARAVGLRVFCHAGEFGPPNLARAIVEELRPDRVTHAVALADWIADLGPASPPVDVCLSSNLSLGVIASLEAHPLPRWFDCGVVVNLSTDDPAVFATSLPREFGLARRICPQLIQTWDRIEQGWMRAAIDPKAATAALAAAKARLANLTPSDA